LESFARVQWRYSYEIILVDHGSVDNSLEVAAEFENSLPLVTLARGANYSFSASNNLAAKMAKGKFLAFANNDLVMLHDCFAPMLAHLDDASVGAVGLKLLEPLKGNGAEWEYITHHQGVKIHVGGVLPGTKVRYYSAMEIGEKATANLAAAYEVPVTTGALLLCRSSDFASIGGFYEGYFYGMEDVDLCLAISLDLGKKIICDTAAVALHNRSATRDSKLLVSNKEKMYTAQIHANNRKLYIERFGRRLTRQVLPKLVEGDSFWRVQPLRVTFIVTDTTINTAAGDLFTALELAEAMQRLYGWNVMFARLETYSLPGTDVVVVMRHDYKIEKIVDANPGLVTVAWARNRMDQWINAPYFDAYQLIFCSSQKSIDYVREKTGRDSILLPIATNANRFAPCTPSPLHTADVTFTGSFWLDTREAVGLQDLSQADYEFAIYGHKWDTCPQWVKYWRGAVGYRELPEIYSSTKIVLDDSHPVTREWDSLNSRVFDALGCGKLVLTNCAAGAKAIFPDLLPNFDTAEELQVLIKHYLANPEEREALAAKLRAEVLAHHTYDNRAATFKEALLASVNKGLRFAIKIGVPKAEVRDSWGDYHFALGIKRALEKQGHLARIDLLPDWDSGLNASDDVVIVLRGLSQYQPQPTALNLMWLISHPDDVKLSEYQQYDHVFVASTSFADKLANRLEDKVSSLLQCADPQLFYKEVVEDLDLPDVLFVGNSRGQRRPCVQYALETNLNFAVYGELWEGMLPPSKVRGKYIPNAELRQYYSSAKVVLNDHWADMRSEGFISNRIFDAGACGANIISDDMSACKELFGEAISYFDSPQSLAEHANSLLEDAVGRKKRGEKLRKLIHENHTFDHRVADILAVVDKLNHKMINKPGKA
jgi:spore maturation protein CgeB/GT2 family glycosyltransferase